MADKAYGHALRRSVAGAVVTRPQAFGGGT